MKPRLVWTFLAAFVLGTCGSLLAADKPRVLVLTDIENEPDDAMSMVRFLTYSNQWDVEGLVATTSVHQKDKIAAGRIREIVEAYGKVRDNLETHEPGYPTAAHPDGTRIGAVHGRESPFPLQPPPCRTPAGLHE